MKEKFIQAYIYCYGATRKQATEAYKNATPGYIQAVIDSLRHDAHAALYED